MSHSSDHSAVHNVGSWLLRYSPLLLLLVSVVASATASQIQINQNSEDIASNEAAISKRVPTFLYDIDKRRLEAELIDVAEGVDGNEEVVQQLQRGTDQINGKIELEVERLRNLIRQSESGTNAKLETILRLLEQELQDNNGTQR